MRGILKSKIEICKSKTLVVTAVVVNFAVAMIAKRTRYQVILSLDVCIFYLAVCGEKMTKKKPRFGAIPKLNLPKKSHETAKPTPRAERSVVSDFSDPSMASHCYKTFEEVCKRVKSLQSLKEWQYKRVNDKLVLKKMVDPFLLPELELVVDDSLGYTAKTYGCYLPEDHDLYVKYRHSMRNVTVSSLEGY